MTKRIIEADFEGYILKIETSTARIIDESQKKTA